MFELLLCSLLTVFPDYLYRRYVQGKRLGREITVYTVWYELRWGIITCLILTISLITLIFYYHPSTKFVTAVYRTVTILPKRAAGSPRSTSGTTMTVSKAASRCSGWTAGSRRRPSSWPAEPLRRPMPGWRWRRPSWRQPTDR